MAWELRDGRRYYYRARRSGKRVLRQYVGKGPDAEQAACIDAERRRSRQADEAAWRQCKASLKSSAARMNTFTKQTDAVAFAVLVNLGCYWHNDSEWRFRRERIDAKQKAG